MQDPRDHTEEATPIPLQKKRRMHLTYFKLGIVLMLMLCLGGGLFLVTQAHADAGGADRGRCNWSSDGRIEACISVDSSGTLVGTAYVGAGVTCPIYEDVHVHAPIVGGVDETGSGNGVPSETGDICTFRLPVSFPLPGLYHTDVKACFQPGQSDCSSAQSPLQIVALPRLLP